MTMMLFYIEVICILVNVYLKSIFGFLVPRMRKPFILQFAKVNILELNKWFIKKE